MAITRPARTALILTLAEHGKSVLEATVAVDSMLEFEPLSVEELEDQHTKTKQVYEDYERHLEKLGLMLLTLEAKIEAKKKENNLQP